MTEPTTTASDEAHCPCCLRGTLDHDGDCAWCRDHCMICAGTVRHGIR